MQIGRTFLLTSLLVLLPLVSFAHVTYAQAGTVGFTDVADPLGIDYQRAHSPAREAAFEPFKHVPVFTPDDVPFTPIKVWGAPGVALLDLEGDGDLDLYVANGPGAANATYLNRLAETGSLSFAHVVTGAEAMDQDSSGVCFGDLDNDGDPDLYVLGIDEPNRLFDNLGNGAFVDVTDRAGVGGGVRSSSSCTLGDVDGDGLLDLVVGNSFVDWTNQLPIFAVPFARNQHNQLFRNLGGLVFEDVSASSGIRETRGFDPPLFDGFPTITWALALVDFDQDGDVDLLTADDQAAFPRADDGPQGIDRGLLHVFENDGAGHFTDVTLDVGTNRPGAWMGLSFGDFNHDGRLDFFASNTGPYMLKQFGKQQPVQGYNSRWFLANADGGFDDPQAFSGTAFGWGTSAADFDNDGDTDVIYHGGLDTGLFVDASNPGVLLVNDGAGRFEPRVVDARHARRNVQGLATGDLDQDGFVDVVTVSNFNTPPAVPLVPYPFQFGSPYDGFVSFVPTFAPTETPGEFVWAGFEFSPGDVSVELNRGGTGGSVTVELVGSVGFTRDGRVSRDGIGALVRFTPRGGLTALSPVLGGSSYASQHALEQTFGLGDAPVGTLEVLWPGGVVNRLAHVRAGERIVMPEIPCNFADPGPSPFAYVDCVQRALRDLVDAGVVDRRQAGRLRAAALSVLQP